MASVSEQKASGPRDTNFRSHENGRVSDEARDTADKAADTTRRAADTLSDATRQAADQGREAVRNGLNTMAQLQGPVADVVQDQSRRAMEVSSQIVDTYRQAAESSADDVQALVASYSQLGRGLQQWQQTYFDLLNRSMERAGHNRQALLRCGSPVEVAKVQRDIYRDTVQTLIETSTHMLQLTGQITQEAVKPLQGRAHNGARA